MGELELYGGRLVPGAEVVEGEIVEEAEGFELADLFIAADEAGCESELFAALIGAEPIVRPDGACAFCFGGALGRVVPGEPRYSRRYMAYLTACAACFASVRAFK